MRSLVLCLVLVACNRDDVPASGPSPAKSDVEIKRVKPHEIAAPNHDAAAMAGTEDEFVAVKTEGSIEASLNGVVTTLSFLPTGSNVAIVKEDKGIARVSLGGAASSSGLPILMISLDGVRLDQLKLPTTFTTGDETAKPRVRIEYRITEQKIWESQPGGTVTIDSYVGKRVKGSFAGKLDPRAAAFGPPIAVTEGRFDVELRLNGASPGS